MSEIKIKRYSSPRLFQADANLMIADGWTLQAQSQETGQTQRIKKSTNYGCVALFFGWPLILPAMIIGAMSSKRRPGDITATWTKN